MKIIGHIRNGFATKFGIPRQSGVVPDLKAKVVLEREYRVADAFRGLESFSHIWLIWQFSESIREEWSPTVRPPRLGGNTRVGVFATRSPFRPNPIGLSCVRLDRIELSHDEGPVLYVSGADLMDGTPIYDIKPYLPFADCVTDAKGGLMNAAQGPSLEVDFPAELLKKVPESDRRALIAILAEDPRPAYQDDPARIYGFVYNGLEVRFKVSGYTLNVYSVNAKRIEKGDR